MLSPSNLSINIIHQYDDNYAFYFIIPMLYNLYLDQRKPLRR